MKRNIFDNFFFFSEVFGLVGETKKNIYYGLYTRDAIFLLTKSRKRPKNESNFSIRLNSVTHALTFLILRRFGGIPMTTVYR